MNVTFILNGEDVACTAGALDRLSELLRDTFGMASVNTDCGSGRCGTCLVLMDGRPVNSCLVPAFRARDCEIITYEGFSRTDDYVRVQAAFDRHGVDLCPFCRPARYLAIGSAMDARSDSRGADLPSVLSSVLCTCSSPAAVLAAAMDALAGRQGPRYSRDH
ncbi:MAG TPA: 2Fe-2S iron-sulfur cluster-binding protein [Spirochaetales bacterium]|nr:2Fe-2S iron-sulfur cluster-binding protein [Spirochaetales bacterium]